MSNVLRDLWNAGSITLWADYRGGTARDFSPLQRHGTVTAPVRFSPAGAHFAGVGRIVHPADVRASQLTGCLVILGSFDTSIVGPERTLYSVKTGGGATNRFTFEWYLNKHSFETSTGTSTSSFSSLGKKCIAINYSSGTKPELWLDGLFVELFNNVATIVANSTVSSVGNLIGGSAPFSSPIAAVVETNRVLTASEHSALYGELARTPWPAVPQRSLWAGCSLLDGRDPTLLASYDLVNSTGVCFDKTGTGNGAVTGTASDLGPGGMPALQFNGTSDRIITTTTYVAGPRTFSLWVKNPKLTANFVFTHGGATDCYFAFNGTSSKPLLYLDNAPATSRLWTNVTQQDDNLWHHWILTINLGVEDSALYCDGVVQVIDTTNGTGYGNAWGALNIGYRTDGNYFQGSISDLRVFNYAFSAAEVVSFRRKNYAQLNVAVTDWGAPVSDASRGGVAGQYLENTAWQFSETTARYKIDVSTHDGEVIKTIVCTTGGATCALYRPAAVLGQTPQEAAYGTWEISFYLGAAASLNLHFITTIPTILAGVGGNNGYALSVGSAMAIYRYTNGVIASSVIETAGGFIANSTWYRVRIKRTAAGLWSMWIKGGAYTTWTVVPSTGPGPFVNPDNTYVVSAYQTFQMLANGAVSLGTTAGNDALTKALL